MRRWSTLLVVVGAGIWAFGASGATPSAIVAGWPRMGQFASRLWPPDLSPEFLSFLILPLWQTVALALAGLAMAVAIGFPLAILATGTLWLDGVTGEPSRFGRLIYGSARAVLDFLRAVPDLAWALMFVAAVGLGPVPALLALALSYGGMLGKIYAEIFESLDPFPAEGLRAIGASRTGVVAFALLPQAWPLLLSYTLYAWECCMRAAAVMGFVGGGGLGYQIDLSMRMFEYGQVGTLLLALFALIGLVDLASFAARRLLVPEEASRHPTLARVRVSLALAALAGLLMSGLWANREGLLALFTPGSGRGMARFLGGFLPPELAGPVFERIPVLAAETLAVSIAGTVVGMALGAMLAIPAARTMFSELFAGRAGAWIAAYHASRLVLNGLRAIPEVLWALMFVLAVGLGPFAGVLAIGVHTGGVLGKLYAEAIEEVDSQPVEALVAIGAGRVGTLAYGSLPLAMPIMASYTLFRWEMNLRVAAILGFVGGGGLGQAVWEAIQLGFHDRLATLIIVIFGMVWLCDRASALLRRNLAITL